MTLGRSVRGRSAFFPVRIGPCVIDRPARGLQMRSDTGDIGFEWHLIGQFGDEHADIDPIGRYGTLLDQRVRHLPHIRFGESPREQGQHPCARRRRSCSWSLKRLG